MVSNRACSQASRQWKETEDADTWQAKGMTSDPRSSLLGSGISSHFFNLPSVSPVKEGKGTAESPEQAELCGEGNEGHLCRMLGWLRPVGIVITRSLGEEFG